MTATRFTETEVIQKQFKLNTLQRANDVQSKLHCAVWNVCSLNNKVNDVMQHLPDHHADFAYITETWLKSHKNRVTADIKEHGFILKHIIRNDPDKDRGGGVEIVVRSFVPAQLSSSLHSNYPV